MPDSVQNIIALIGMVILGGIGFYFFYLDGSSTLQNGEFREVSEAEIQAVKFRQTLAKIQALQLDKDIFADDRFNSLVVFGTAISTDETGRDNPFVPTRNTSVPQRFVQPE